jgi:hypothetical protein
VTLKNGRLSRKSREVAGRGIMKPRPIFAIPPRPDAPETIFGDRLAAVKRQKQPFSISACGGANFLESWSMCAGLSQTADVKCPENCQSMRVGLGENAVAGSPLPFSLAIIYGLPPSAMSRSSSRPTRKPECLKGGGEPLTAQSIAPRWLGHPPRQREGMHGTALAIGRVPRGHE